MNLVNPTSVSQKKIGDGLTAEDVNSINNTLNSEVEVGNNYLKKFCNINQEYNKFDTTYSLAEAVKLVPASRRTPGMVIRFLTRKNKYTQYVYSGTDTENWEVTNFWKPIVDFIDGGEW